MKGSEFKILIKSLPNKEAEAAIALGLNEKYLFRIYRMPEVDKNYVLILNNYIQNKGIKPVSTSENILGVEFYINVIKEKEKLIAILEKTLDSMNKLLDTRNDCVGIHEELNEIKSLIKDNTVLIRKIPLREPTGDLRKP